MPLLAASARSDLEVRNDHVQIFYENRKDKCNRRIPNKMLVQKSSIEKIIFLVYVITFGSRSVVEINEKLVKD